VSKGVYYYVEFKETECENVEWIDLAPDTYIWRASLNTTINLRVPYMVDVNCLAKELLDSVEGSCCLMLAI